MGFPLLGGAERILGEQSEGLGLVLPRWGFSDFVGAGTSFYKANPSLGQVWVRSQPDQVDMHASTQACPSAPEAHLCQRPSGLRTKSVSTQPFGMSWCNARYNEAR